MADEASDSSNKEQLVICIRWVDTELEVHEDFIGLYEVDKTDADTITRTIFDALLRLSLPLDDLKGQCYDGASTMSGKKMVLQLKLNLNVPNVFIHIVTVMLLI